jgi:sodium transport system permease protein
VSLFSWGRTGAFAAKEVRELRRDRRAILVSFVLPILVYPATFSFMTHLERRQIAETEATVFRVLVTGEADAVREGVRQAPGLVLAAETDEETARHLLREEFVDVWVIAPAGPSADTAPTLRVLYHGPHENSAAARDRVREMIDDVRRSVRDRRFQAAGGRGPLAELLPVQEIDVATAAEAGGAEAGRLVPFLLLFTLFLGASPLAVDAVAGEKEHGTLETLYLTPVRRIEIARAKFLVVTVGTMITGALNLASLVLCYRLGLIGDAESAGGLVLSSGGVVVALLLILPLAAMIGGLLLGVSAFARSQKEAQYYLMPVMLVAFVPGMLSMTQDVKLDTFTAVLPLANVAIALRDALAGSVAAHRVALVIASSAVWAALVLRWTAGLLSREDTILGFDPEPLLGKTRGGRRRAAYLGIAATLLGFFYLGQMLQTWNLRAGLALTLWVLLPALAAVTLRIAWAGGRLRDVLSLRRPTAGALAGGALLGAGLIVPVVRGLMPLQSRFLPMPEDLLGLFDEAFHSMSVPMQVVLIALSPGVCEELTFRGAFLGLLRRTGGTRAAVVASSLFFALIHLSVYRFAPTFLLGLVLAGVVVRTRSIFPAMVLHAVYNGLAVTLGGAEALPGPLAGAGGWIASAVALGAGAALVRRGSAQANDAPRDGGASRLQPHEVDPTDRG